MGKLVNLARMTTATTGTGPITLGTAVPGHISFAAAGAATGDVLSYAILDAGGAAVEVGSGTYNAGTQTLTRALVNSTTGALLNLSGSAEVMITDLAVDHVPQEANPLPGTPTLIKSPGDIPVWGRMHTYSELRGFPTGSNNGAGSSSQHGLVHLDGVCSVMATGTAPTGEAAALIVGSGAEFTSILQNNTTFEVVLRLLDAVSDGTNTYRCNFGVGNDTPFASLGAEGVFFTYDPATYGDANLRAVTRNASVNTVTDTGVAMAANIPRRLLISYDSVSQVRFYVNELLLATHTTNIPPTSTNFIGTAATIKKTAGTANRRLMAARFRWARYF